VTGVTGVPAGAGPTENASESVTERRIVEGVEEWIDGRVCVAEPEYQLIDKVPDRRRNKRFDDEHGEVGYPADGKRSDHRRYSHHRFALTDYLRRLSTSNKRNCYYNQSDQPINQLFLTRIKDP